MGIEDEIARQDARAQEASADTDAAYGEVLLRCEEFLALVTKHRVRPSGDYYRDVRGVLKREGVCWRVTSDDYGVVCAVTDRGEPVRLASNQPAAARDRMLTLQPPGNGWHHAAPYYFSEEKLASAYRHAVQFNGHW